MESKRVVSLAEARRTIERRRRAGRRRTMPQVDPDFYSLADAFRAALENPDLPGPVFRALVGAVEELRDRYGLGFLDPARTGECGHESFWAWVVIQEAGFIAAMERGGGGRAA